MADAPIPSVTLPSGEKVPALGLGTWRMGEDKRRAKDEIAALKLGLDLGMTLIDTAEMYGDGGSEEVVAQAIEGRRDRVWLVSKVLPSNASRRGAIAACERSLKRLRTGHVDLYLLHWRGGTPLAETVEAFVTLKRDGKIRHWGVSNFDTDDMIELEGVHRGGDVAANQVLYNLARRGIEYDLLGYCQERGVPIMAYSPIDQASRMLAHPALKAVASRHKATPAQVALAFLLRQKGMIAIPKASSLDHVRENRAACGVTLSGADTAELDKAFPPPSRKRSLEMI